jgi:hypothetical protein
VEVDSGFIFYSHHSLPISQEDRCSGMLCYVIYFVSVKHSYRIDITYLSVIIVA